MVAAEGVPHFGELPENGLNFQVALHPGGAIEIRWGDGNPPTGVDTSGGSGIADDAEGITVYPTGFPFSNDLNGPLASSFPSNQCRTFVVTATGNYTEWPWS